MIRTFRSSLVAAAFVLGLAAPAALFARGASEARDSRVLTVYCYDSFASEWGPGPLIAEGFAAKTGIAVEYVAPGDAVAVLSQLILEKDRPRADVVLGLDDSLLDRAAEAGVLEPFAPAALADVPPALDFDPRHRLVPYDYGDFAVCYDAEAVDDPPRSLEDLTDPRFAGSLVVMDPRTSSPGLGFLLWTVAVYGDGWTAYWDRLKPSILTVTDGWSQGYALFTAGEAPLVVSYATSPVYHAEYEGEYRYKAAEFSDGHYRQIEGVGLAAGTDDREAGELFIEYLLSERAQRTVALYNIMMPARRDVPLPASFDTALRPAHTASLPGGPPSAATVEDLVRRWTELFVP